MSYYDELDRQAAEDPVNAELDSAIEAFTDKFGKAPLIPVEVSFSRESLIKALMEAAESGDPGQFRQ